MVTNMQLDEGEIDKSRVHAKVANEHSPLEQGEFLAYTINDEC